MKQKNLRLAIDIAMSVLMVLLMGYSLVGEALHEGIGILTLILFLVHHFLNRRWYKGIFRGRENKLRIFRTVLDVLLLACMIAQPLSGILMSKHLFSFIRIPGISASAREVHLLFAYWTFVLSCMHAGAHLAAALIRLERKNKTGFYLLAGAWALVSIYGMYAFVRRQLPEYMFRKTVFAFFDFSEPRLVFFLDYLSIMALFALAGVLPVLIASKKQQEKNRK